MKKEMKKEKFPAEDDLGISKLPLCREPWESYYILRRGILPCCHGNPIIAPMSDWAATWNSPRVQEIRHYLSQGKLSPYCLESLGCPIVQRYLGKKRKESVLPQISPLRRPRLLRFVNRLFFKIPGRIWRVLNQR